MNKHAWKNIGESIFDGRTAGHLGAANGLKPVAFVCASVRTFECNHPPLCENPPPPFNSATHSNHLKSGFFAGHPQGMSRLWEVTGLCLDAGPPGPPLKDAGARGEGPLKKGSHRRRPGHSS